MTYKQTKPFKMSKKRIEIPRIDCGDTADYCMIDYHRDFTKAVNEMMKTLNIKYKVSSTSFGGETSDDDWEIEFRLEEKK